MARYELWDGLFALQPRKKLGRKQGLSEMQLGYSRLGEKHPHFGIYQKRTSGKGTYHVKMKFYEPTNPRTVFQQEGREKFAVAVLSWQGLTSIQKKVYNDFKWPRHMSGYNRYIRLYMEDAL